MASPHPFDPLAPAEISLAARIIRQHVSDSDIIFRVITLWDVPKEEMVPFLDREHALDETFPCPPRCVRVQAYIDKKFCEYKVNLDDRNVVSVEVLHNRHSHIDSDLMRKVELACLANPQVQEKITQLKLPKEATVVVEP